MATIEQIRALLGETEAKIEKTINDQVEGIVVNAVDKVMADRVDGKLDGMQKAIDELQANVKVTETRLDDMASAGHVMDAWGASASSFTGTGNGNKRRAVTGPEGDAWSQYVGLVRPLRLPLLGHPFLPGSPPMRRRRTRSSLR